MVTAVMATLNEAKSYFLPFVLEGLDKFPEIEVIAVDGGSTDETLDWLRSAPLKLINAPGLSEGERYRLGVEQAIGSMILLQNPQCLLEEEGIAYLLDHEEELNWGGFRLRYETKNPMLGFNSWYSNELRGRRRGILTFEHCLFFRKSLLREAWAHDSNPLISSKALSETLREYDSPKILPFFATASVNGTNPISRVMSLGK